MNRPRVIYRLFGLLFIPLFFIVSCSPISTVQPVPTVILVPTSTLVLSPSIGFTEIPRSGLPAYARPGPYTVGMTSLDIPNGSSETKIYLWYPVREDKKPDTKGSPFPAVVFAPGYMSYGLMYGYLLKHIASYGFVTATWEPRNEDDTTWTPALTYRPTDFKSLLDYLESMNSRGGPLEGMIDMKRVVVAGHSMGGGTALEESGAPLDFGWCAAHQDLISKDQECTCYHFVKLQKEIADYRGFKAIPEGKWPQMRDPRIVAMVAMAPMGKLWGAEYDSLAAVQVPALVMVGAQDTVLLPELAAYPVYEHLGSQKKSLVVFEQMNHDSFAGPGYSSGPNEDIDQIRHVTTAFILAEVKGDQEAAKTLSPANMKSPGVRFETTEFNH
jgi:predicted dienelactone hydrolase